MEKDELIRLYDKQANQYERLRRKKKTFDQKWRKQLLAFAKGKILEVSVGAGANFKFYPTDADVTAVDISAQMIDKAKDAARDSRINATLINSSVEDLRFETESFDTIVSTLSLCAYDDPVHVLKLFNDWCKKDGVVLLLEHGTSKYKLFHWLQNRFDNLQYRRIGCHANRKILQIVKDAGLKIKMCERKLFGIMYLIWAQPKK
jgi:ubiquinone/menaquinone biosynthesis C-methylase UbiE